MTPLGGKKNIYSIIPLLQEAVALWFFGLLSDFLEAWLWLFSARCVTLAVSSV